MILAHLLIAFLVTIVVGLLLLTALRRTGPLPGALGFLLLIFLASWVGGIWISPFGPTLWGAFFLPFLTAGIIVALLLVALFPKQGNLRDEASDTQAKTVWSVFFWVLLASLAVVIIAGYFFPAETVY